MANISAADVKKLRDLTGAGMMDCKRALEENDGDLEKAIEFLRIKGQATAEKRADRTASNGLVAAHVADGVGTLVEVNCETDFVSKGDTFQALAQRVLDQAVAIKATTVEELLASEVAPGQTVAQLITDATGTIGEKIEVRGVARVEAPHVASYLHRTSPDLPPQIGVLVGVEGDAANVAVARDVAMHAAAMKPAYLTREAVPADVVAAERHIAEEKSREEGKPEQALPRIVEGRVDAFFKDVVLLEQKFAKDQTKTVKQVLTEAGVAAQAYARFQVGA
ncbi:MAG: elongation factor Ts [Kineosporiaceae bacterium]|nr:elongation factor Ts [Kineosporiaceae bacterium]MBK7625348.1 elongation factor Ts [Kineosporiaceae bacterium]MBK8076291.1 elongation factor Ts [Kineosporiaceae bacterium]